MGKINKLLGRVLFLTDYRNLAARILFSSLVRSLNGQLTVQLNAVCRHFPDLTCSYILREYNFNLLLYFPNI